MQWWANANAAAPRHFRFGSDSDVTASPRHVRFPPESGLRTQTTSPSCQFQSFGSIGTNAHTDGSARETSTH
jgi:hypothetical protein